MHKKLLTMAVASALAVPSIAFADVTMYGIIDTGLRNVTKLATPTVGAGTTDSLLTMAGGTKNTTRWGLKGSDDLGNGLKLNYVLEGQFASDTGGGPGSSGTGGSPNQGIFQRRAIVGLSKDGNSIHMGREYTVAFKVQGIWEPLSYSYAGIATSFGTNTAGGRATNLVTAATRFANGGLRVDYGLGEVLGIVPAAASGNRLGFGADFAFGPLTVGAVHTTVETAVAVDTTTTNFGARYKMGWWTFRGGFSNTEVDTAGAKTETPQVMFGVQYSFGKRFGGRLAYYDLDSELQGVNTGNTKTFVAVLEYTMSKRTVGYVVFDRKTLNALSNTAALLVAASRTDGSTGLGIGIKHSF